MTEPSLAVSWTRSGEDLLVSLCGFVTSLLTAVILWWTQTQFGFGLYTWMFWFIIPIGSILSGFAGASGYYAGSWLFGHRPTRLLLVNMVLVSLSTFFLIHYLSYITLEIEGKRVSDYIPFTQYLDIAIRSSSMEFRVRGAIKVGSTHELGAWGYIPAMLQIAGFAVGGFVVYAYLVSKPYCERCSRYLSAKGKQVRYTGDADGLQAATAQISDDLRSGAIPSALDHHKAFGYLARQKNEHLRSVFAVRHCKRCGKQWVKFSVEKWSGHDWKEIPERTVGGFTDALSPPETLERARSLCNGWLAAVSSGSPTDSPFASSLIFQVMTSHAAAPERWRAENDDELRSVFEEPTREARRRKLRETVLRHCEARNVYHTVRNAPPEKQAAVKRVFGDALADLGPAPDVAEGAVMVFLANAELSLLILRRLEDELYPESRSDQYMRAYLDFHDQEVQNLIDCVCVQEQGEDPQLLAVVLQAARDLTKQLKDEILAGGPIGYRTPDDQRLGSKKNKPDS